MERLQKVLAHRGIASRRKAEELITAGRITVNGRTVTELGTKVDPEKDRICLDGKAVGQREQPVYYLLNKPAGYVTTVKDPEGRPTVLGLLKGVKERVYPVGRLDYDTEGLLLLTNDGELTHRLTHPSFKVPKTYRALVEGIPAPAVLERLRQGVELEDGMTAPAQARFVKGEGNKAWIELTIHEGRNRQVRRMGEAVGHRVLRLERVRYGPLTLAGLARGAFRPLTGDEVARLKKTVQGKGGKDMLRPRLERGLVQIYTGKGKGTTEAALGLTMRAMGHGFRVWYLGVAEPPVPASLFAPLFCFHQAHDLMKAVDAAKEALVSGEWDLLIIDGGDRLPEKGVLALIEQRPPGVELVITCETCPYSWQEGASLLTEARDLKDGGV